MGQKENTQAITVVQPKKKLLEKFADMMGGVEPEKMLATLKATAFKLSKQGQEVTNEQMMALLVVANKYDLNPFIKEIYAFPDKGGVVPIVGVDGWSRMINNHKDFDGIRFEFGDATEQVQGVDHNLPESCTCFIYRKDRQYATEVTEYLDEVYRKPGNYPGPWQTHTRRMLRHKAMIQCARLAFGFTGIHDQDEAENIVSTDYTIVNEEPRVAEALTDRFSQPEEPVDPVVIIEPEVIEPEPIVETVVVEPEVIIDEPIVEPEPVPERDFAAEINAVATKDDLAGLLAEVAASGLSKAKLLVLKKVAKAKSQELADAG